MRRVTNRRRTALWQKGSVRIRANNPVGVSSRISSVFPVQTKTGPISNRVLFVILYGPCIRFDSAGLWLRPIDIGILYVRITEKDRADSSAT